MEYVKYNIMYNEISQTEFNTRLNNHWKDIKSTNLIPACKHFNQDKDFDNKVKLTLIKTLNLKIAISVLQVLKIKKLRILIPYGLNHDCNFPDKNNKHHWLRCLLSFCMMPLSLRQADRKHLLASNHCMNIADIKNTGILNCERRLWEKSVENSTLPKDWGKILLLF